MITDPCIEKMENRCKNCIHFKRQFSTYGNCNELTRIGIENKSIQGITHGTTFDGRPTISFSGVAVGEDFGKDCEYFLNKRN